MIPEGYIMGLVSDSAERRRVSCERATSSLDLVSQRREENACGGTFLAIQMLSNYVYLTGGTA
jgi:hypothetical protein